MKRRLSVIFALSMIAFLTVYSQDTRGIKTGMTSEQNLQAVTNPSLYSSTSGFDERYEGIKGSPRLMDTLIASTVILKGENGYYEIDSDIDVVRNTLLFILPSSGDLLEVASTWIDRLVIHTSDGDMVFRTTEGLVFDREIREAKFCQVLSDGPYMFIKIPDRDFQEANYTGLYSPDKRYDEYTPADKYYIMGSDSIMHRTQLTRKSLTKLFPSKAKLITANFNEKSGEDPEKQTIKLLEKF